MGGHPYNIQKPRRFFFLPGFFATFFWPPWKTARMATLGEMFAKRDEDNISLGACGSIFLLCCNSKSVIIKIHLWPYQVYIYVMIYTFHIYQWTFQVNTLRVEKRLESPMFLLGFDLWKKHSASSGTHAAFRDELCKCTSHGPFQKPSIVSETYSHCVFAMKSLQMSKNSRRSQG